MGNTAKSCFRRGKMFLALLIAIPKVSGRPPNLVVQNHMKDCLEGESGAYYYTSARFICCSCNAGEHWTEDCKCLCVSGSYAADPEISPGCKLFTECPPGFEPKIGGDSNRDVECGPCLTGMCSYKSSSTEKCIPCINNATDADDLRTTPSPRLTNFVVSESPNNTAMGIGIGVGVVLILIIVIVLIRKYRKGRTPFQCRKATKKDQNINGHGDVKYKAAKTEPNDANGSFGRPVRNGHSTHDTETPRAQEEDSLLRAHTTSVVDIEKKQTAADCSQPQVVDLPKEHPKTADNEMSPKLKYFVTSEDSEKYKEEKSTLGKIIEEPRAPAAQGREGQQSVQDVAEPSEQPTTSSAVATTPIQSLPGVSTTHESESSDPAPQSMDESSTLPQQGADDSTQVEARPGPSIHEPASTGQSYPSTCTSIASESFHPSQSQDETQVTGQDQTSSSQQQPTSEEVSDGTTQEPVPTVVKLPLDEQVARQFEDDLALFENPTDKKELQRVNVNPDVLHEALKSPDYLEAMCEYMINTITSADLKEMLRSLRLLDEVTIEDIEDENRYDSKQMRRKLFKEMRSEHGDGLNPRILLQKASKYRMRKPYDDLCKGFLEHYNRNLSNQPTNA